MSVRLRPNCLVPINRVTAEVKYWEPSYRFRDYTGVSP